MPSIHSCLCLLIAPGRGGYPSAEGAITQRGEVLRLRFPKQVDGQALELSPEPNDSVFVGSQQRGGGLISSRQFNTSGAAWELASLVARLPRKPAGTSSWSRFLKPSNHTHQETGVRKGGNEVAFLPKVT